MPLGALEVEILVQVLVGANYDAIMSPVSAVSFMEIIFICTLPVGLFQNFV